MPTVYERLRDSEEEDGVTGHDETDACRKEKVVRPGGETDGRAAQTETSHARRDQTPAGQEKNRYSLIEHALHSWFPSELSWNRLERFLTMKVAKP